MVKICLCESPQIPIAAFSLIQIKHTNRAIAQEFALNLKKIIKLTFLTFCYKKNKKKIDRKDISFALLLQLVLPQVIFLQLMLDDIHTQCSDLIMCNEPMKLRKTAGKTNS